ncbi:MAG TPA: hypothetical protein VGL81_14365 [Polyangiaceae bacterium]|jgi:hypothetical protein
MMSSSPTSAPPSSRRLPVAAFESVREPGSAHVVLHVFCPRAVAAMPITGCRDCPSCVAFDPGDEERKPAVVCGW